MNISDILGPMRKAIEDFDMIQDGDKIAVGLSGGKDSITLLNALKNLQRYYPKSFELIAITIHPGNDNFDTLPLEKMCKKLEIEYIIYRTNISKVVFDIRNEKNPCSLCANMRRGMLNSIAIENKCTKIALGHHKDDVMETFLMSTLLNGKIHTFAPVTYLSRSDIKVIRPMIYIEERDIRGIVKTNKFEIVSSCCKVDGNTMREYMKNLIKDLSKDIPKIREHIFGAIKRSNITGWNIENNDEK